MEKVENKRYAEDGSLIVSELWRCPFFEMNPSGAQRCCSNDCFGCKYSDFRKQEYIDRIERQPRRGILYSICHNEKNKIQKT